MSPGKLGQKRPTIASTVVAYLRMRKSEIDITQPQIKTTISS